MSELQPGMLALVIGYKNVAQNLGKIVKLDRLVKNGERFELGKANGEYWIISGEEVGYTLRGELVIGSIGLSLPEHLMPIKPEADPLEIKVNQELHA